MYSMLFASSLHPEYIYMIKEKIKKRNDVKKELIKEEIVRLNGQHEELVQQQGPEVANQPI